MKKSAKGLLLILLVLLCAALVFIVARNYTALHPSDAPESTSPVNTQLPVATLPPSTPEPSAEPSPVITGETANMTLAVAGDMVVHSGLNQEALQADGSYDYTAIFQGVQDYVNSADFALATLETTFAGTAEYTGYPQFKSPDGLAATLAGVGFDLINTASNHSMDSYNGGLVRTLDVLEEAGLRHVGTFRSQEERDANSGITMVEVNGISIAFLSYSYGTNGIPLTDHEYAVNLFYEDYMTNLSVINYDLLDADMAAARESGADIIAVCMHWGLEYQTTPSADQYELADYLFQQGADLILGGHPHVPEPMETREVTDLEGKAKTGYICYCLGNLISCQTELYTNLTAVVSIGIEKNLDTGDAYITDVSYAPMYMMNLYNYGIMDAGWRYRLLDLHAAIDAYESGTSDFITESMYKDLVTGLNDIHSLLGKEFDARAAGNGE